MKSRHKEIYFIFSLIIILLVGFVLGSFLATLNCQKYTEFQKENIVKCQYEIGVYQEYCGYMEHLIMDEEEQRCHIGCLNP